MQTKDLQQPFQYSQILLIALFFLFTFAAFAKEPIARQSEKFYTKNAFALSFLRNIGKSVGINHSYSSIEFLCFPYQDRSLWPFLDLRVHRFDQENQYASNVGLGLRVGSNTSIFGINAYYDFRKLHRNHLNQMGIGLERLGSSFNFRLNGYIPIGKKKFLRSSSLFNKYEGDFFILHEKFLNSLPGVNFEVEALIAKITRSEIYMAMGPYYYSIKNKCREDIYGVKYRLSVLYSDFFNIVLTATHDNVFKTRVQVQFDFSLLPQPLDQLFQRVKRNELIVQDNSSRWTWNF